jgi:hypothetical protein
MNEYYTFPTEAEAQGCIDYINATPWFPLVGNCKGQPNPAAAATTSWATTPTQMLSGSWAVPKIPEARLDFVGVPQEDREGFNSVFGQDILTLGRDDFPTPTDE